MYRVKLVWPQDSTNRSRPSQWVSDGSWRMVRWNSVYASGARLMAVPGWPLPTFWTASAASTRMVSTASESRSVQSSGWSGRGRVGIWSSVVTNVLLTAVGWTESTPSAGGRDGRSLRLTADKDRVAFWRLGEKRPWR